MWCMSIGYTQGVAVSSFLPIRSAQQGVARGVNPLKARTSETAYIFAACPFHVKSEIPVATYIIFCRYANIILYYL